MLGPAGIGMGLLEPGLEDWSVAGPRVLDWGAAGWLLGSHVVQAT